MTSLAIQVNELGKKYRIGAEQPQPKSWMQGFTQQLAAPFAYLNRMRRPPEAHETLWALRDVSFEVPAGSVMGLIGHNGAGKSTLLKILSRITEPSVGSAKLFGRVGSLLEVGTGFHPELTGRENIYLSGTILGMSSTEIGRKFDEIVDFSGVERFLDTPIKRYSSGMSVRLGFAVAAHLEPEILLIDEVLAVGDAEFQKKCLGKMQDVAGEGRTVLFVSHNMGAITQLCPRSIWLKHGKVAEIGNTRQLVGHYLAKGQAGLHTVTFDPADNPTAPAVVTKCQLTDAQGQRLPVVSATEPFHVQLDLQVRDPRPDVEISVRIYKKLAAPLFTTNLSQHRGELLQLETGHYQFSVEIPSLFLSPDSYSLHVGVHRPLIELIDVHDHLLTFIVQESGTSMWQYQGSETGNVLVSFPWTLRKCE